MGSPNQLEYIRRHAARLAGPFLEVGAKDYGSTQDLRALFLPESRYVGVDLALGPGVDRVVDLAADFADVDAALGHARFGTVFCLSVLEHCRRPFRMAENITRLLAPEGTLVVAVPFAFKYHPYPADYWRFTPDGVRGLFGRLEFADRDAALATTLPGALTPLDGELGRIVFSAKAHRRGGHPLRAISAKMLSLAAKAGVLKWLAGYRYVLPPTEILMIGSPRADAPRAGPTTSG